MPSANARPRAVARPIRRPVKLPGPVPTTRASIWPGSKPTSRASSSAAASTAFAVVTRSPSTAPSRTRAHVATEVAVSKAKIVLILELDRDAAARLVDVLQSHGRPYRRQPRARVLRPLDERNRAIEVRLEVAPLLRLERDHAVEVEVRDGNGCLVAMADRERRAGDRPFDAERAAGAADERGLARAEVSRDGDDVAGAERDGEPRPEAFRLRCRGRLDHHGLSVSDRQKRPSWTGSAGGA